LSSFEEPIVLFLFTAYSLNVALAFFNLLPFPPLDGSKILYTILLSMKPAIEAMERFGFIILRWQCKRESSASFSVRFSE
jgi:Zn-dependent protease